ncbi:MAG: 50S ribosomal protein L24 [Omnitrophica WOR_2 bacterium RIFCSPLOWO2_12_FULL_51_8]|nr:MAG: 50S ribosomal protein L24 [Omnitrophica WOR_2 bacterium RIFCSPLOWO2_12_FULL_51_8]
MSKIKKGDTVQIMKGKDRGKKGKVVAVFPKEYRALVEGLNLAKKHKRQTRQDQQGGILQIEAPISINNLALFCRTCSRPVRAGFSILQDKTKARICKICKEAI